jgi:transposase InsO family protein
LLTAALTEYGCPAKLVSDNGAVFTVHAYCGLLETLGIEACYIEKGQPWENLIEAQFKVQVRLADHAFEQAQDLAAIQHAHAQFVETFNTIPHWAHQDRVDGMRTPEAVLAGARGRRVFPDELRQLLRELQFDRSVDRHGYVSIQRFYIYAERGLTRQRVSIWLYERRLHIASREARLARYTYRYDRKQRHLRTIEHPQLYTTPFADPQLELWELDDEQWRKVLERMPRLHRAALPHSLPVEQLPLWLSGILALLLGRIIAAS